MSNIYPNTYDQRRINNSDAKTLLQNWVEEREVQNVDTPSAEFKQTGQPHIKYFQHGHKGILSNTNPEQAGPLHHTKLSTYKDNYISIDNYDANGEAKGIRHKLTEQMLTRKILDQMDTEENMQNDFFDEPTNFVSEAHERFSVPGFVSQPPKPIAKHDIYSEMPISYWTEQRKTLQGTSQFKTLDTPFKKNTAFSTPCGEGWNNAAPDEMENNPYLSQKSNNTGAIM